MNASVNNRTEDVLVWVHTRNEKHHRFNRPELGSRSFDWVRESTIEIQRCGVTRTGGGGRCDDSGRIAPEND